MATVANFNAQASRLLQPLELPIPRMALQLFLVLYGSLARPTLPPFIKQHVGSYWFQLAVITLILFTSLKDFGTALLIALVFGFILRQVNEEQALGGLGNFLRPATNFLQDNVVSPVQSGIHKVMYGDKESDVIYGSHAVAPQAIFEQEKIIPLKEVKETPQWFIDVAKESSNPLDPAQLHLTDLETGIVDKDTLPQGFTPQNVEYLAKF